jgi:hypothetical protein
MTRDKVTEIIRRERASIAIEEKAAYRRLADLKIQRIALQLRCPHPETEPLTTSAGRRCVDCGREMP